MQPRVLTPLALALLAACHAGGAEGGARGPASAAAAADSLALGPTPRDSADSVLLAPRLVREPTVVVFWLAAADSFTADDQAAVLDELTLATGQIAPTLTRFGIHLVPTNAETVYVALPNRQRRAILLAGLDFPFGYALIDPAGLERIIAGVVTDAELLEEIRAYFDLPEHDTTALTPRIST